MQEACPDLIPKALSPTVLPLLPCGVGASVSDLSWHAYKAVVAKLFLSQLGHVLSKFSPNI